jgi:ligand-binding sensor domain-containing protein
VKKHKYFFCAAIFWGSLTVTLAADAQIPYFKQLLINRDNPGIKQNSLCFDHNSYLWLGTSEGLYKFNGTDFILLTQNTENNGEEVTAVFEDSDSVLWIGHKNGTASFIKDGKKNFVPHLPEGKGKPVTSILKDSHGIIWFTTAGQGIYCVKDTTLLHFDSESGLSDDYVYTSAEDDAGKIWFGTDQGIMICSLKDKSLDVKTLTTVNGLPDEIVRVIKKDNAGNIWVGFQSHGICKINPDDMRMTVPPGFHKWQFGQVNDVLLDEKEIWISTEEHGLVNSEFSSDTLLKNYSSYGEIKFQRVSKLAKDNENNLWLTTDAGLIRSHANWLMFLNDADGNKISFVHSIYCDRDDNLFFTPDQGLMQMSLNDSTKKNEFYSVTPLEKLIDLVSIYEDRCGYLWLGTMGSGLYRLNPVSGKIQKITELAAGNSSVLSIAGNGNELWLATFDGAVKLTLPENCNTDEIHVQLEKFDRQKELGNYYIYTVFADSKNRIWFGTDKQGLVCYDNGKFFSYGETQGLKSKTVFSITEDESGTIWVSAPGEGIYKFNGKTFEHFSKEQGLRELTVTSLTSCGKDKLMMIHRRGIDILNTKTSEIGYYGAENNLGEINTDINAVTKDSKGRIWLGTEKGIVMFDPSRNESPSGAKIILDRVRLFGGEENYSSTHIFSHNQNYFSFDYTGLWFTDPERINYHYTLEGYNKEWLNTRDRNAVFPNLQPGKYTFRVRASLNKNFVTGDEASFSFTIKNPFWDETWFRLLLLGALLTMAYLYIKARDNRMRKLEALKKEKIEFQFATLKSQVNPHFLFNSFNTLISIIEDNQKLAVEYVEKLSELFRTIVNYKDKELIPLKEELEIASTYFYIQQKRFGKNFSFTVNVTDEMKEMLVPPLVLQLLMENAIKHNAISAETPLCVEIYGEANKLFIKNNINKKRTATVSTGTGLQNIINRYKLLTPEAITILDNGIDFMVTLPLLKK